MGFPGSSAGKKNGCSSGCLQCRRPHFDPWIGKIPLRRDRLPIPVFLGFPGGSDRKESACNVGDLGLIPGLGRSLGGGHGNPFQYSCLENPCGQGNLAGYSPWSHKELDMTERQSTHTFKITMWSNFAPILHMGKSRIAEVMCWNMHPSKNRDSNLEHLTPNLMFSPLGKKDRISCTL